MTAVDTVAGAGFRAPRRSRILSVVGFVYVAAVATVTFMRAASAANVLAVGETAAAFTMVAALFAAAVALLVLVVRLASLSVDDLGVSWGFAAFSFRMGARRIAACRVYRDAVAVEPAWGRRFTWYLCARDYAPFDELAEAFRRSHLPVIEDGGRTPFRARLQSYGTAIDLLLILDILGVTLECLLL